MSTPHQHEGPRTIGALLRIPNNHVTGLISAHLSTRFPVLRPAHLVVFQHIDHPPAGTRLTVLADRGKVSKQALIEIVDQLEAEGFLERVPDPGDRRAKLIRLTQRGFAVHEYAYEAVEAIERDLSGRMAPGEFQQLKVLLASLTDALQADPHHG